MPKLWTETIATHRRDVHQAILDTAAALVAKHGLRAVTMSQIADETGIGRATLYKYFGGVEEILLAWHERQVSHHMAELRGIAERQPEPAERLAAVLDAYARIGFENHGSGLAALLHQGEHVTQARRELRDFVVRLLAEGVEASAVRGDVAPAELAAYCLHALEAAAELRSPAAVRRLVSVTLDGLRRPSAEVS